TPYERWNMALTGRYDISDAIRLKVVANYTDSSQEVALAPTPATGISLTDPLNNVFIRANGACGVTSCHPDLLAALSSRQFYTGNLTGTTEFGNPATCTNFDGPDADTLPDGNVCAPQSGA